MVGSLWRKLRVRVLRSLVLLRGTVRRILELVNKNRDVAVFAISLFTVATFLSIASLVGALPLGDRPVATDSATAGPVYTPRPTRTPIVRLEKYGTAGDNVEYVNLLITALLKRNPNAGGELFINTLAAGGFNKKTMEVTPDKTVSGYDADAIEFSVQFDGRCIVGQKGGAGFSSVVLPKLKTGHCLVGKTRPIDW